MGRRNYLRAMTQVRHCVTFRWPLVDGPFYVSFAGLGIGLGLERAGPGLVTAGLDHNTGYCTAVTAGQ